MRYHVLATDYDGTLAHNGCVNDLIIETLKRFLASGRRLVMVTGRELPDLMQSFPHLDLFEWVVAENGGLLYRPSTKEEIPLADPPPANFVQALVDRHVGPVSVGRVVVATWEPHHATVLQTILDLGLELQVIFNKGAVMVLPAGVNKATGLFAALRKMSLSIHNVVGIGDAENDHAFLRLCEVSVAVANALPAVKDTADLITAADHGAGVMELMEQLIANDLSSLNQRIHRHALLLGKSGDQEIHIAPYDRSVLICGPSASGKSTVATRFVEALQEQSYQFCLFDPEGDYGEMEGAVVFGGPQTPPPEEEILRLLEDPEANAVVCMTGVPIPDRPAFFLKMLSQLLQMRSRTGRPHWLILDEAHHLMPADWLPADEALPNELQNCLLITVHPALLAPTLLQRINTVLALGADASETLEAFAGLVNQPIPAYEPKNLEPGDVLMWVRDTNEMPIAVHTIPCRMVRHRHSRKYATGELSPDRSFYFRGPEGKLNLRAQNLMLFLQLADGVDDATWSHHLLQRDYSQWFRGSLKDEKLAAVAEEIESLQTTPQESRAMMRAAVEKAYTLPATPPMPVAEAR